MRILLISGSLPPMRCGIGDYTGQLAESLARRPGTTVAVLTDVAAESKLPARGFDVLAVARGWRFADALPIVRAVRRWKPDIAHMQFPTQGYGGRKLPWLLPSLLAARGVPIVQTWHEYVLQQPLPQLKGSVLNLPNAVLGGGLVVVRPHFLERMAPWYRRLLGRKQVQFIPNAPAIPVVELSHAERSEIRSRLAAGSGQIVAYFGFAYPAKGVELLFEIADPARHHLLLVCDLDPADPYHRSIRDRMNAGVWAGRATVSGFLPAEEVSRVLAAADAVVFPFREGGGRWNTSLEGAVAQGTFVITTSREQHGYDASKNIYCARVDDVAEMRQALLDHAGRRAVQDGPREAADWNTIADAHLRLYSSVLRRPVR